MRTLQLLLPIVGLLALTDAAHGQDALTTPRILVGPNVLASRDGDLAHMELMVAANPRDWRNLVGGAITASRADGGTATKTYASLDGGQTWIDTRFDEQIRFGGGDPQVAFTAQGTALFATLAMTPDETGRTRAALHVYRSEDGGRTWSRPADLRYSWDHPQIAVDQTTGRFAGRVYIGVLHGFPVYRVSIFRSEDDGKTFIGPVEAANGGGKIGINVLSTMVLSDGTLVVPYIDFNFNPGRPERDSSSTWMVTSSDGGITFSAPRRVFKRTVQRDLGVGGFGTLAADTRSTRWRDHLYAAFIDMDGNVPRLMFTRSTDRGVTWSEPKQVSANVARTSWQFQPALAVNDSGVVGLAWFDTRDSGDTKHYDEYFTASLDGGLTWLAPVRVSSASSDRFGAGNLRFTPMTFRPSADSLRISFLSPAARWGDGGDYMGLTADARGVFHPFWADSRTGTFQVMTADVRVETARPTLVAEKAATSRTGVTRLVEVGFEPSRFDAETSTATLTVRLRNTSQQTLQGPLLLEIRGFGSGMGAEGQEFSPTVLNASNGKPGTGAVFDFTPALGTAGVLAPGAYTGSVELRMRLKDPLRTPDLHVEITASTVRE